ncbi:MAG TPA: farnesyl diphosphate synthase [Pyrinomonadaceae bacterium]|nr:farnesyl diphosphate synthase [Pyrinomonadaceae bacterium]
MTRASFEERAAALLNGGEVSAEMVRAYAARVRTLVESKLDELVPAETVNPDSIHAAIRWSLFAPAKRFRPVLLFAVGETFGADEDDLVRTACAFEMIHTYSLVHDDLPAMDDDDLRRGRPTCHVKFGEATAILAGDALQALAFQTIAEDDALDAGLRVRLVADLARAAGTPEGMVAGQAHDLGAEARTGIGGEELELIHRRKTGALICAAARAGARVAGASEAELEAVGRYATDLGLLFQITDDLLDVTASAEDLGKTPGKDARSQKATYPALYGLEAARERARQMYERACAALDSVERPTALLRAVARLILERRA